MIQLWGQVDGEGGRSLDEHCLCLLHIYVWLHNPPCYYLHILSQNNQDPQAEGKPPTTNDN
jgi:hypothetical protein